MNYKIFALTFLILLVISLGIYFIFRCKCTDKTITGIRTKVDTVFIPMDKKPIILNNISGKIKYKDSAEICSKPFISQIDTLVAGDTISISYLYPENLFEFKLLPKNDSIMVQKIIEERTIQQNENWWENPLYVLLGFIFGYLTTIL